MPDVRSDYLYCGLVDFGGVFLSDDPYGFGQFEISKRPEFFDSCEQALHESIEAFRFSWPSETQKQPYRCRCFFLDCPGAHLVKKARLYLRETINLFPLAISMFGSGLPNLLEPGYVMNLSTGHVFPFLPPPSDWPPMNSFVMEPAASHPRLVLNYLLTSEPAVYGELGRAVRRSTHWSSLAKGFDDNGERLLMYWIACECLTKENEGDEIVNKLLAALGFVRSKYYTGLSDFEKQRFAGISDRTPWESLLKKLLDRYREVRNDIAHFGFSELDIDMVFSDSDQRTLNRVLRMLVPRLQHLAVNGLALGCRSVRELWQRHAECATMNGRSVANDLEGTVLYFLNDKTERFDE